MKLNKQPLGSFGLLSIVMGLAAAFLGNLPSGSMADDPLDLGSLNDVGIYLRVDYSGTTFNRRTGEMRTNLRVTNISSQEVNSPLVFLLDSISVGEVSLNGPLGMWDGKPYVDLTPQLGDDGILSPGETSVPRILSFSNPDRLRFSFEAKCLGVVILSAPPAPKLDSHPTLTAESNIIMAGSATQAATVKVSAPSGVFEVPVSDNRFTANIPLVSNKLNHIFFTSRNAGGVPSAPTAISIVNDSSPPNVQIQFPKNGALITTDKTDVAGFVADVFSGFEGLSVTVNGFEAEVDVGIGTNGTFFLPGLSLAEGTNVISATATDVLGNTITKQISVERISIPANAPKIKVVSGNAQSAPVDTFLAEPIVVEVTQGNGSPLANKVVKFEVTKSNGQLSGEVSDEGTLMYQTRTDANGLASAIWRVGSDAGCGNNRVEVTSRDILGTTAFCATATPGSPDQINIGTGSNQRGEAGAPAALPLTAWVSDGCNGVGGIPVTFVVTGGGGEVNGQQTVTVPSSRTGHASVNFTYGPSGGTNRITATYPGNPTNPAVFNLFGLVRDEENPTTMSGIVLDNGKNPIGNARCVLTVDGVDQPTVFTDAEGKFFLSDIDDGAAHFHVDATEANLLNGKVIPLGSFPALTYELVIVPNAENSLPTPVLLPPLNPANAKPYDGSQDVELTVEEIEGLKMIIKAGSMTLADGTVPSLGNPATLSLNQVHHDDIPMPMPDGAAPPFAWTLQPASATFDPPIEIQYPNMSGLPPGAVAYFLSFNHDSGDFEIVAPGRVIPDGSTIVTEPGTGLSVSGWGCNCPPYSVTGECENCVINIHGQRFVCPGETVGYSATGNLQSLNVTWGGDANASGQLAVPATAIDGSTLTITATIPPTGSSPGCSASITVQVSDGRPGGPSEAVVCLLNPIDCLTINDHNTEARNWAATNEVALGGGLGGGCADAARHAYFNALASRDIGAGEAKKFADAHEESNFVSCQDNNMDLNNNAVGRRIGSTMAGATNRQLQDVVVNALRSGQLVVIQGGQTVSSGICNVTY